IDQGLDAGQLEIAAGAGVKAEQAVDLVLVEHAVGAALPVAIAAFEHGSPFGSGGGGPLVVVHLAFIDFDRGLGSRAEIIQPPIVRQFVLIAWPGHYCTRISLKSTLFT